MPQQAEPHGSGSFSGFTGTGIRSTTGLLAMGSYQLVFFDFTGGPSETRTPDPLIKSQLLYQLS
jgi:hypothetical protein